MSLNVFLYVCVSIVLCVDSETSAVHSFGDSWLRWKGQRVEYCHCPLGGRERCHVVPVISESNWTQTPVEPFNWLLFPPVFLLSSLMTCWMVFVSVCLPAVTKPSASIIALPLPLTCCYNLSWLFFVGLTRSRFHFPVISVNPHEEPLRFSAFQFSLRLFEETPARPDVVRTFNPIERFCEAWLTLPLTNCNHISRLLCGLQPSLKNIKRRTGLDYD